MTHSCLDWPCCPPGFIQNYPGLAHDFAPMISEYEKALTSLVQDWGMPSSGLPQLRAWLLR